MLQITCVYIDLRFVQQTQEIIHSKQSERKKTVSEKNSRDHVNKTHHKTVHTVILLPLRLRGEKTHTIAEKNRVMK